MSKIEQLKELLKENPNDTFLNYALALEQVKLHNYNEAVIIFQLLVKNEPKYLATYLQLGNLLSELGQNKQAEDIYLKGIEIAISQNKQKAKQELEKALFLLD
jgi:Flp pilus assembly protein TadD